MLGALVVAGILATTAVMPGTGMVMEDGTSTIVVSQVWVDELPTCTEEDGSSGPNPCGWNQGTGDETACSYGIVGDVFFYTTVYCRDL